MNNQRERHEPNVLETWKRNGFVPPTETRVDYKFSAARSVPALHTPMQPRAVLPRSKD
jgi:hypothetical protein